MYVVVTANVACGGIPELMLETGGTSVAAYVVAAAAATEETPVATGAAEEMVCRLWGI